MTFPIYCPPHALRLLYLSTCCEASVLPGCAVGYLTSAPLSMVVASQPGLGTNKLGLKSPPQPHLPALR